MSTTTATPAADADADQTKATPTAAPEASDSKTKTDADGDVSVLFVRLTPNARPPSATPQPGPPTLNAQVEFASEGGARRALAELNELQFAGRALAVSPATATIVRRPDEYLRLQQMQLAKQQQQQQNQQRQRCNPRWTMIGSLRSSFRKP